MPVAKPIAPARTASERRLALEKANEIRFARARLKQRVKAGELEVADLLLDPPDYLGSMKVLELMTSKLHMGRARALPLLEEAQVSPLRTVSGLTPRQRVELAALVRDWSPPEHVLRWLAREEVSASSR